MQIKTNEPARVEVPQNRLNATLERLARENEKALAVFLMGGDPDPATSGRLLQAAAEGGADIIEIGIPFSDPLADGPVIQNAAKRALGRGITPAKVLELARGLRRNNPVPIALLVYYNTVLRSGQQNFARRAAKSGADALIVPDLPFEEKAPLEKACRENGLVLISMLAPTTPGDRMEQITGDADGFIYCVSRPGVTGVREGLYEGLDAFIKEAGRCTSRPLLVGFGISNPEQARHVSSSADGVIVGSALVQEVESGKDSTGELCQKIRDKVSSFKRALATLA